MLVDRYKGLIYSIPVRMGATPQDAADIFQAVCLDLFNELPELREAGSPAGLADPRYHQQVLPLAPAAEHAQRRFR